MTVIDTKDDIKPVYAILLQDEATPDECPADFDLTLHAFMMPVPGMGNCAVVLDAVKSVLPFKPGDRVVYKATEAEVVATMADMIRSQIGPERDDGGPANICVKLAGWNMVQDLWPILSTKWFRYREECEGGPYRGLSQDPALRWFSHPSLLNVDASYRQGRPTKHGFCAVDMGLALRYLLNDESVPAVDDDVLLTYLVKEPEKAILTVDALLGAMQRCVWESYGPKDLL